MRIILVEDDLLIGAAVQQALRRPAPAGDCRTDNQQWNINPRSSLSRSEPRRQQSQVESP